MPAEHLAQGLVHQMRRRVVAHGACAGEYVDFRGDAVVDTQHAGSDDAMVAEHRGLNLLRILDRENTACRLQHAAIADLAAGLGVERRLVENDDSDVAFAEFIDRAAVTVERQHLAGDIEPLVTVEGRRRTAVVERSRHPELAGSTRLLLLLGHGRVESGDVDAHPALAADIRRQVEREAEGVVQLERRGAVEDALTRQAREFALEDAHAMLDGFEEAHLFLAQDVGNTRLLADQLGIRRTHFGDEIGHQPVEESRPRTELVAMPDGASDDAPQDVATALVARYHAVGNQERTGADVIGKHTQRRAVEFGRRGLARRRGDQPDEQVDLVVAMHVLEDRRRALEPHAGIHRRLRQRVHHTGPRRG